MAQGRIAIVALRLEQRGIDPGHLRVLQEELDVIERPPGIFGRLSAALKQKAATQWGHLVGELRESAEVMGLISGRLRNQRPLTPEERDKVRAQMLDLLKVVPAGLIAVGNAALPIPGTGIFTPWILVKLGLMPSRWREAHLLDQLQREQARLREQGHSDEAEELQALYNPLGRQPERRLGRRRAGGLRPRGRPPPELRRPPVLRQALVPPGRGPGLRPLPPERAGRRGRARRPADLPRRAHRLGEPGGRTGRPVVLATRPAGCAQEPPPAP